MLQFQIFSLRSYIPLNRELETLKQLSEAKAYRLASLTISRPISLFGTENTKINIKYFLNFGMVPGPEKLVLVLKKNHDQEPLFIIYGSWFILS